jgi:hypothetical protein
MRCEFRAAALLLPLLVISGCAQQPIDPSSGHIRGDEKSAEGQIPPPVQMTPLLPKPKPSAKPETYSVVVNNVRIQELLFALARDARMQIDIDPTLTGSVTLPVSVGSMSICMRASRASANSSSAMRTLFTTTLYVSGLAEGFGLGSIGVICTGGGIAPSALLSSLRMWPDDGSIGF